MYTAFGRTDREPPSVAFCPSAVSLHFIERGKPTQNAFIESFNGKFRDECLNQNWFTDLADARRIIEAWRVDYNTVRPHSALGDRAPALFAAAWSESASSPSELAPKAGDLQTASLLLEALS